MPTNMARHAKYPRRPRRVASERLYAGGTRSVASALNADAPHAQIWQRPMWLRRPEYRATPQSVFAKMQESMRPRVVGRDALLRDRWSTTMARHAKYPRRPRRVALWGVSNRSGSWRRRPTFYKMWAGANHVYVKERPEVSRGCAKHQRNGRGASFPAIGVSILPEKKEGDGH